ncbi:MAG: hypothetical protein KY476_11595 [Planctomycetes bacterium]|nr:hypothetical protein [Planctomycetota bacterium]
MTPRAVLAVAVVCLGCSTPAGAEDAPPSGDDEVFAEFREAADDYVITLEGHQEPLELHATSLLNWSNPVRQQERGSVFVWLKDGRPQVAGSIFTYATKVAGEAKQKHELQSLSSSPLSAWYDRTLAWRPRKPGVEWRSLAGSPAVRDDPRSRLVQMRQFARMFQVTLSSPRGDETKLRLMPQPLLRYSSKSAGVLDGALFSFVVATDPEALLSIEAAAESEKPTWRYAFARFHYWKLEATDASGQSVWLAEEDLSHNYNPLGNSETLQKTYNSFQPWVRARQ